VRFWSMLRIDKQISEFFKAGSLMLLLFVGFMLID
jgi:hypothetical protein